MSVSYHFFFFRLQFLSPWISGCRDNRIDRQLMCINTLTRRGDIRSCVTPLQGEWFEGINATCSAAVGQLDSRKGSVYFFATYFCRPRSSWFIRQLARNTWLIIFTVVAACPKLFTSKEEFLSRQTSPLQQLVVVWFNPRWTRWACLFLPTERWKLPNFLECDRHT